MEYGRAKAAYQRALRDYAELGAMHPDGGYALRTALTAQESATANYRDALLELNDLVIRRKLPNTDRKSPADQDSEDD
jgi:hypothetical protein